MVICFYFCLFLVTLFYYLWIKIDNTFFLFVAMFLGGALVVTGG